MSEASRSRPARSAPGPHRVARARAGDALELPRLRDVGHRRRALPDVRDGLKPVHRRVLYSMWANGNRPAGPYVKCANIVGYVMGNHHPHGDSRDLRHARPPRAAVLAALPARRRPGQLRLDRRRPGRRRCGTPKRASRSSPRRCSASSTRTPSTSGRTTTSRSRSRSSCRRGSRTCSSTARPGSPSGWRRTCRRTTSARRSTRSSR